MCICYSRFSRGDIAMKNDYLSPEIKNEELLTSDVIMGSGNTRPQSGDNLNSVAAGAGGEAGAAFGDL